MCDGPCCPFPPPLSPQPPPPPACLSLTTWKHPHPAPHSGPHPLARPAAQRHPQEPQARPLWSTAPTAPGKLGLGWTSLRPPGIEKPTPPPCPGPSDSSSWQPGWAQICLSVPGSKWTQTSLLPISSAHQSVAPQQAGTPFQVFFCFCFCFVLLALEIQSGGGGNDPILAGARGPVRNPRGHGGRYLWVAMMTLA